jgi:hypothetical protein
MIHEKDLSAEDITLSDSIKKRAIHVLNSEVKSVAAASGLMVYAFLTNQINQYST